jgi:hypothetical protein
MKARYLDELVKDFLLAGARGRVVASRNPLYQFLSRRQTQLPPASVARHVDF